MNGFIINQSEHTVKEVNQTVLDAIQRGLQSQKFLSYLCTFLGQHFSSESINRWNECKERLIFWNFFRDIITQLHAMNFCASLGNFMRQGRRTQR